jgi:hypothetical protein
MPAGHLAETTMDFENIWYEYAPYLYLMAGVVVIEEIGSILGTCAGIAMLAGAARVLLLRWNHRATHHRKSGAESD